MSRLGNVLILGDSYSTFEGHIPAGYVPYYAPKSRPEIDTDVKTVEQTWWHQLIAETDSRLILNCSWSGTTVCNTGHGGRDASEWSFVARLDQLIEKGFFEENKIDTLLLYGGINDSAAHSPLGELQYSDWNRADLYNALPAFCYLLWRTKQCLQGTRVVCMINPTIKPPYADGYRAACAHYDVECVDLVDLDIKNSHPTVQGMVEIKDQLLDYFKNNRLHQIAGEEQP